MNIKSNKVMNFQMGYLIKGCHFFLLCALVLFSQQANAVSQSINLNTGWNLISFAVLPQDKTPANVFVTLETAGILEAVQEYDTTTEEWISYPSIFPGSGYSEVTVLEVGKGYWVNVTSATTLVVSDSASSVPVIPLNLQPGWNLFGLVGDTSQSYSSVFEDVAVEEIWRYDTLSKQFQGVEMPGAGAATREDFTELVPGVGYWIYVTELLDTVSLLASKFAPQVLTGPITGNTTLIAGSTYYIGENIEVTGTLTIPAGVTLKFVAGAKLSVGRRDGSTSGVGGTLNINGASNNPVMLTSISSSPQPGDWVGIYTFSNQGSDPAVINIQNAIIEYADIGLDGHGYTLGAIINSTLRYTTTGIVARSYYPGFGLGPISAPLFVLNYSNLYGNIAYNYKVIGSLPSAMDASNNWWGSADVDEIESALTAGRVNYLPYLTSQNGLPISGLSLTGPISGNTTLAAGETYLVGEDLEIIGTLTIPQGTTLKFAKGANLEITYNYILNMNGALNINGTTSDPVTLTSVDDTPEPGDWSGIYIHHVSTNLSTTLNIQHTTCNY